MRSLAKRKQLDPRDATGARIRRNDIVRVIGTPPDLAGRSRSARHERDVFGHIVGRYYRVVGFGPLGHVELMFKIRSGPAAGPGFHFVEIDPSLVRVRRPRSR